VLTSLKQLLSSIVDYAGIFPPAQLNLPEAMLMYDRAQSSSEQWMLNQFVLPASRLQDWIKLLPTLPPSPHPKGWCLSVILSQNWSAELDMIEQLTQVAVLHQHNTRISAWEIAPLAPDEIKAVRLHLPAEAIAFWEIPVGADLAPYLPVLQQTGMAAKLRTGGITSAAFPDCAQLSQSILSLAKANIPFKATAGLHHALRGDYRITYDSNSVSTTMHGFLNVALLAAFALQQTITFDQALALLEESSIAAFQFTHTAITWRDRSLSLLEIDRSRKQFFRSFGSCSFQEPIDDLNHLKLF
jgi:hypothetical protein